MGKVNEENRKLYHENSSLKHRLNELVKVIERREQINQASKVTTSVGISSDAVDLENSKIEVKNLKN